MDKVKIINLPKIEDDRGNLTFVEGNNHIPFEIMRAYWIYDVPCGQSREGHAFRDQQELIISLSGSFDVSVDDGYSNQIFLLNRSYSGLYIDAGIWRKMGNFSTNSVALILSSTEFSEEDYIRNYLDFLSLVYNG